MARRRSTVASAELQSGERHALTPLADFKEVARGADSFTHIVDLYSGAGRQGRMREVGEFGHPWTDDRRHARRADLDQVLPSRGRERAADNRDRAHRVVERHLAGRVAQEAQERAGKFAYIGRRLKKRDFRSLWIIRINAACRENDISYSKFINGLNKAGIELNRKMLSEIAYADPQAFAAIVSQAKAALGAA